MTDKAETPLTSETIAAAKEAMTNLHVYEKAINERVEYVIKTIYETFGLKVEWWDYGIQSHHDNEYASDIWSELFGKNNKGIEFSVMEAKSIDGEGYPDRFIILNEESKEQSLDHYFPLRWLTEEFEPELKDGKKRWDDQVAAKKAKETEAKSKKDDLAKTAKAKLSKSELEALKASLDVQ